MSDCLKVVKQYMLSVKDGLLLQQCGFIEYEDFHKGFLGCYAMAILSQIVWIKLGCIHPNLIVNECDILV